MGRTKFTGLILLLISLLLAVLLYVKYPNVRIKSFPINNPVEVPFGAYNFCNLTLEPVGKEDYHFEVRIRPFRSFFLYIDFWVVNASWVGPLLNATNDFWLIFEDDYPDKTIFSIIPAYDKKINFTGGRFEITTLDRDGIYCFVFFNRFEDVIQNVSFAAEERYLDPNLPYRSFLDPNPISVSVTCGTAVTGLFLLVRGSRRRVRRAKLVKA